MDLISSFITTESEKLLVVETDIEFSIKVVPEETDTNVTISS